jgi:hypothetical protein
MTKTAQGHGQALSLADLDTVVGGSATPTGYFRPVAIQAGATPGVDFASTSAVLSAADNFGLAGHFNLSFPTMVHDTSHAADGTAPSVPGSCHGAPAAGADDHGALAAALPLSLLPVPGQLSDAAAAAPAATAAATATAAPADASAALYLGLPGGADAGHADTAHAAANHWAPGSFDDSAPAGVAPASFAPGW